MCKAYYNNGSFHLFAKIIILSDLSFPISISSIILTDPTRLSFCYSDMTHIIKPFSGFIFLSLDRRKTCVPSLNRNQFIGINCLYPQPCYIFVCFFYCLQQFIGWNLVYRNFSRFHKRVYIKDLDNTLHRCPIQIDGGNSTFSRFPICNTTEKL